MKYYKLMKDKVKYYLKGVKVKIPLLWYGVLFKNLKWEIK